MPNLRSAPQQLHFSTWLLQTQHQRLPHSQGCLTHKDALLAASCRPPHDSRSANTAACFMHRAELLYAQIWAASNGSQ